MNVYSQVEVLLYVCAETKEGMCFTQSGLADNHKNTIIAQLSFVLWQMDWSCILAQEVLWPSYLAVHGSMSFFC